MVKINYVRDNTSLNEFKDGFHKKFSESCLLLNFISEFLHRLMVKINRDTN